MGTTPLATPTTAGEERHISSLSGEQALVELERELAEFKVDLDPRVADRRGPVPMSLLTVLAVRSLRNRWRMGTLVGSRRLGNWVAASLAVGLMVALAGCSSSDAESSPPVSADETSTSTTTTTAPPPPASTEPPPPEADLADLEVLWGQLWDASGLVPEQRVPAIAELGDAIHPIVAEGVPTMLIETTERKVSTFPVFNETRDGTIEIRDCIIYEPMIFESITHVHSGTAIPDGEGGWIIDSVTRETRGCVPAELQAEILEDYAEFWDAQIAYSNPVDPDHPDFERTLTVRRQEVIRERLVDAQVNGRYVVLDVVGFHPEISAVTSAEQAEVLDCIEFGPDTGFFERGGDRVGEAESNEDGKTDLYTVSMVKEGDQWRVDFVAIKIEEPCEPAPTPAGLPQVGP